MPTVLPIPELAVVEVSRCTAGDRPLAVGMVMSADEQNGVYAVEVVNPRSGSTFVIHALPRQLRVRRLL